MLLVWEPIISLTNKLKHDYYIVVYIYYCTAFLLIARLHSRVYPRT